jgi:hypothetical protein
MNADTKFILRRMEALEGRLMNELKELQAWKNKALGAAMVVSGITSVIIDFLFKK